MPIFEILMSSFASVLAGLIFATINIVLRKFRKKRLDEKTYSERLSELTSSLSKASSEVDAVLGELSKVAKEKESAVKRLEDGLSNLEKREKELKDKIEMLQSVPIPVAEHFAKLIAPGERRGAMRDYILFGSGVVVTTIVSIALQVFSK